MTDIQRSKDRLYVVMNDQYLPPREFTDETVRFGVPVPTTEHNRNSKVTVSGIPGKGYYGDVDIYYNRLDLGLLVEPFTFRTEEPITAAMLANYVRNVSDIEFTVADIAMDTIYPELDDGAAVDVQLIANPASLQFTGAVTLHAEYGRAWLDTAIRRKSLGVLTHPNPDLNRTNGMMLGWDVDWSAVLEHILPHPETRKFSNFQVVRRITALLGYPTFLNNTVVDRSTKQVPGSNTKFERVVVLATPNSSRIYGPLYFHYNRIQGYL